MNKKSREEDINSHTPVEDRRIPFENMIYIGDSNTDVPSMTVVQKNGGHVIAVFDPNAEVSKETRDMVEHGRANHFAPADYSDGSLLDRIFKNTSNKIMSTIAYGQSVRMSLDWVKRNKS